MKRFFPDKELPPYAFVPGKFPHPEKPGGHMEYIKVESPPLTDFKENMAYLYAVDLYNHGFYWESHVWWEHLWHLAGRKGDTADFLKGLIKMAAGKLKLKMGDEKSAEGHFLRAEELLTPFKGKSIFFGLDTQSFLKDHSFILLET